MPPYIPNEIITAIFEHVYDSLCINPAQTQPDFPIGASVIFSQFSLVSKRFHDLSLPLLVRNFEGKKVESFTEFIKKHELASSVRSFYLNPELIGFEDPEPYEIWPEGEDFLMGYQSRAMREEAMEKVEDIHQKARRKEFRRWKPLLKLCMPSLTSIEIGSRRRDPSEEGPYVGEWDARREEDFEMYEEFTTNTAPALELGYYLDALPISPNVVTVRLNLPAEPSPTFERDDQFTARIAGIFPKLRHYTVHLHNDHDLTERWFDYADKKIRTLPPLETLRIFNARCETLGLEKNILPSFLAPSAATLRHFELQTPSEIPFDDTLFGKHVFSALETLIIDSPSAESPRSDFFTRFPNLLSASFPVDAAAPLVEEHAELPIGLTSLALFKLTDNDVESATQLLKYGLETGSLQNLRRYVLKGDLTSSDGDQEPLKLSGISTICKERGIELCYERVVEEERAKPRVDLDSSGDEVWTDEGSEDEEHYYDSEDEEESDEYW